MSAANFAVLVGDPPNQRQISPTEARVRQTLRALAAAGPSGITSLEVSSWALRLGHYVWLCRTKYGLNIATEHESHLIGEVQGQHARYRCLDRLQIVQADEARAA